MGGYVLYFAMMTACLEPGWFCQAHHPVNATRGCGLALVCLRRIQDIGPAVNACGGILVVTHLERNHSTIPKLAVHHSIPMGPNVPCHDAVSCPPHRADPKGPSRRWKCPRTDVSRDNYCKPTHQMVLRLPSAIQVIISMQHPVGSGSECTAGDVTDPQFQQQYYAIFEHNTKACLISHNTTE